MTRSVSSAFNIRIFAAGDYPDWRTGMTKDVLGSIPDTAAMSDYVYALPSEGLSPPWNTIINGWCGFASDGATIYSSLSAGHAQYPRQDWQNQVLKIDLLQNAPAWTAVDPGTTDYDNDVTIARRYNDGRPASRHTYSDTALVKGAHTYDSKDRIFHMECFAAYAEQANGVDGWNGWGSLTKYSGGAEVEGFRIADAPGASAWDADGYWNPFPGWNNGDVPAVATNASTGLVYVSRNGNCWRFDASEAHGIWTPLNPSGMDKWEFAASTIDTKNGYLVGLLPSVRVSSETCRLQKMLLSSPYTISDVPLQNYTPQFGGYWEFYNAGMVYDADNDRFLVVRPNADTNSSNDSPLMAIAQDGTCAMLDNAIIPRCAGGNGPCGRLVYVPTLKCVVYASRFSNDLHVVPTVTG